MTMTDKDLSNFFRLKVEDPMTKGDIGYAGDVNTLMPLIYHLCYSIQAKVMVEIGTADGSTAFPMLKAAEENDGLLYSVDPTICDGPESMAMRLVKAFDLEKYWRFNNMKSDEFFKNFDKKIDFALIDGDHSFPQVAKDVRNCCQRLNPKGLIFVTDFSPCRKSTIEYINETGDIQCADGIYKGLNLVINEFPELSNITLFDRVNASVIIGRSFQQLS